MTGPGNKKYRCIENETDCLDGVNKKCEWFRRRESSLTSLKSFTQMLLLLACYWTLRTSRNEPKCGLIIEKNIGWIDGVETQGNIFSQLINIRL